MTSISASIVAYHEEKNIEACLQSLKGVADEIIVVHDGPCNDNTLKIAKKYTKKVFTRPRVGEAEPHRSFALSKCTKDWVLVLDADEFLSAQSKSKIKALTKKKVNGFIFDWPFYDKGKKITTGPLGKGTRLALFRRLLAKPPRKFHEWYHVPPPLEKVNLSIDHKNIAYDNWTWPGFYRKNYPRARYDARHRILSGFARYPFFVYLPKAIIWFTLIFPYVFILQKAYQNGELGLRISLQHALYNFYLYYFVFWFKIVGLPSFSNRKR